MGKTVCLVDVDGHNSQSAQGSAKKGGFNFPNLALMKLSAWHKAQGDTVEWYRGMLSNPDIIYASKVFTFTKDFTAYMPKHKPLVQRGGTGYDFSIKLPDEVENTLPDLTLYDCKEAYGFLSRGCIRKCPWCVVPKKEGAIYQVDDIIRVSQGMKNVVLLDNNFLGNDRDFILDQLDKAIHHKIRVDFNQALDARLVTDEYAEWLAKTKWIDYIRFACDTDGVMDACKRAITLIRDHGYKGKIMVYVLSKEIDSALWRITELAKMKEVHPYCMPYRNLDGDGEIIKGQGLKLLARWCNRKWIMNSCTFEEYMREHARAHSRS